MRLVLSLCLTLLVCSGCVANSGPGYSISKPTKNKHHAIFQIRNDNGGGCTAFVISDTLAVTAGHCVSISKAMLLNKEEILLDSKGMLKEMTKTIDSINCSQYSLATGMPEFMCERALRDLKRDHNELSSFVAKLDANQADTFFVYNSEGVALRVRPVALDSQLGYRDFAILEGDFSDFEKLTLIENLDIMPGDKLRSCGFANLKVPPICTNFIAIGNSGFAYKGNGMMIKGMSGGPVLNSKNQVVGINVAVGEDAVLMTPVIGIMNKIKNKEN